MSRERIERMGIQYAHLVRPAYKIFVAASHVHHTSVTAQAAATEFACRQEGYKYKPTELMFALLGNDEIIQTLTQVAINIHKARGVDVEVTPAGTRNVIMQDFMLAKKMHVLTDEELQFIMTDLYDAHKHPLEETTMRRRAEQMIRARIQQQQTQTVAII